MWSKPEYTEMRFGFEVTMYIANRKLTALGLDRGPITGLLSLLQGL